MINIINVITTITFTIINNIAIIISKLTDNTKLSYKKNYTSKASIVNQCSSSWFSLFMVQRNMLQYWNSKKR